MVKIEWLVVIQIYSNLKGAIPEGSDGKHTNRETCGADDLEAQKTPVS